MRKWMDLYSYKTTSWTSCILIQKILRSLDDQGYPYKTKLCRLGPCGSWFEWATKGLVTNFFKASQKVGYPSSKYYAFKSQVHLHVILWQTLNTFNHIKTQNHSRRSGLLVVWIILLCSAVIPFLCMSYWCVYCDGLCACVPFVYKYIVTLKDLVSFLSFFIINIINQKTRQLFTG